MVNMFELGQAAFSSLSIRTAGEAYVIRFSVFETVGLASRPTVFVDSKPFDVTVGDAYQLGLPMGVGTIGGGGTFDQAVVVALLDRGGNAVGGSVGGGTVTCTLLDPSGMATLSPSAIVRVPIAMGSATFTNLSIDRAGTGYRLNFACDLPLAGSRTVISQPFSVGIGPPRTLAFLEDPVGGGTRALVSGQPLAVQPRVGVYDAGGNLLVEENSSGVLAAVSTGPPGLELRPASRTLQVLDNGVATFSGLYLSVQARAVVLRFMYCTYDPAHSMWIPNENLYIDTKLVPALPGAPVTLRVAQPIDGSWAGGRGFRQQPHIALVDGSGSVAAADTGTIVTVTVTPSLSVHHAIVIDTSGDPAVTVTSVTASANAGAVVGVGDVVAITVTFSAPVTVERSAAAAGVPALALSAVTVAGSVVYAVLAEPVAALGTVSAPSEELIFAYTVAKADALLHTQLEATSFLLSNAVIADLRGQTAITTLPAAAVSLGITLSSVAPTVVSVSSSLASGSYPVTVMTVPVASPTQPEIPLPTLPLDLGGGLLSTAEYTSGNNTAVLTFTYTVTASDATTGLAVTAVTGPAGSAATIVLPAVTLYDGSVLSAAVLQRSDTPSLNADLALYNSIPNMAAKSLLVDTAPATVVSTAAVSAAGTYRAGETVTLAVTFLKTVSAGGDLGLALDTGGRAAYVSGSGSTTLHFAYTVRSGDASPGLTVIGMDTGDAGWCKRYSDSPTPDADLTLHGVTMLSIVVDGTVPRVLSVAAETDPATYHVDDTVGILATFNKGVSVLDPANAPVIVLQVAPGLTREAVYVSSPSVNILRFEYRVRVGDAAVNLGMRFYPQPLCQCSGCPVVLPTANSGITETILTSSSTVIGQPANLFIDNVALLGLFATGTPIGTTVTIDPTSGRTTTTVTAAAAVTLGSSQPYGIGDIILFTVTFSDEVVLASSTAAAQMATLSNGGVARLVDGLGTETLTYAYPVAAGDTFAASLDLKVTGGQLVFTTGLVNRGGVAVDLSAAAVSIATAPVSIATAPDPISIDATRVPHVLSITTDKPASPWGYFSPGEIIDITVTFDLAVRVTGAPQLLLNTGRYAQYAGDPYTVPSVNVNFIYTVEVGDATPQLACDGAAALEANGVGGSQSLIQRTGALPSISASVTLPVAPLLDATSSAAIAIDGTTVPHITSITSPLADGIYGPGDAITVTVNFNKHVTVVGAPALRLGIAGRDGGGSVLAALVSPPAMPATALSFVHVVRDGDVAKRLDIADPHALEFGFYEAADGFWYEGALRSRVGAAVLIGAPAAAISRVLPFSPGALGSLSAARAIEIDGLPPHVTRVYTAAPDGAYATGAAINVLVEFSGRVMVVPDSGTLATPVLWMETGAVDRAAPYVGGSGTATLAFRYTVATGDASFDLDYWCDDADWRYAGGSLDLRGGKILAFSSAPSSAADTHLNPPGGLLQGAPDSVSINGVATYRELFIRRRGRQYRAWFTGALGGIGTPAQVSTDFDIGFSVSTDFDVGFSVEFELVADAPEADDAFGSSLAFDGDIVVAGAPGKHLDQPAIQIIRVDGAGASAVAEVQVVGVAAHPQFEVQEFSTYVAVGAAVAGTWAICYAGLGCTSPVPAGATTEQVREALALGLPSLGRISVARRPYVFCACSNAYTWTLTFEEPVGEIIPVTVDKSGLKTVTGSVTAAVASVTSVAVLQEAPVLGGTFKLGYNGWAQRMNHLQGNTTRALPYDATGAALKTAIEADLGIPVAAVAVDCCDAQGGRSWSVTFGADHGDFNVSALTTDATALTTDAAATLHSGAYMWTFEGRQGEGPVLGTFRVRFRGSDWTPALAVDASAADVEVALNNLDSIRRVEVTRGEGSYVGLYAWSVTFLEVREATRYGYVDAPMGVLPAMEVDDAWEDYADWEGKVIGSFGAGAGAVYVYHRSEATAGSGAAEWDQTAMLRAHDTDASDAFGHIVDISESDGLIAVGAPYAEETGVLEVQLLTCSGGVTGGTFTLSFRGFTTDAIPYDVSALNLYRAIRGPFGATTHLHSIPEIELIPAGGVVWGVGGFCGGSGGDSAQLTFRVPPHGYDGGDADIEPFVADTTGLIGGVAVTIETTKVRKGTANPSGPMSKGLQTGAAYLFGYDAHSGVWAELQKVSPAAGKGTDRFGWSVALLGHSALKDYLLVGAPGENDESGAVHVYTDNFSSTGGWGQLQVITSELYSSGADQYGSALSASADTVAVGAVGYDEGRGAVDIWLLSIGGILQAVQRIKLTGGQPHDQFGYSISLHDNMLVVGCPGCSATWRHTGLAKSETAGSQTGAVFVYQRSESTSLFTLFQILDPSNVKPGDRLGQGVSASGGAIVATSLQAVTSDDVRYQRSVQVVTVQAVGGAVGNTFRLGWRQDCRSLAAPLAPECHVLWSDPIETDAEAVTVKAALESAFGLGESAGSELYVTRSGADPMTQGHQFTVVFLGEEGDVPKLVADASATSGPGAYVSVEVANAVPSRVRGMAHVFQRVSPADMSEPFVEQCFLYPFLQQRQDLFGSSVALSWPFVAVGAPNRDTSTGGIANLNLVDANTGTAIIFTLDFLRVRFSQDKYQVPEGETATLEVNRSATDVVQVFFLKSLDRNAPPPFSTYVASIFDLRINPPDVSLYDTPLDVVGAGTAMAGAQQYGSAYTTSLWSAGAFDYRALADYIPIEDMKLFDVGTATLTHQLVTNDDGLVETPDESVVVAIYLPGMFPSLLGDLMTSVVILDNNDGEGPTNTTDPNLEWGTVDATPLLTSYLDTRVYTHKMACDSPTAGDAFGAILDTDGQGEWVVVGDPKAPCEIPHGDALLNCGAVYVLKLELGVWVQEAKLLPPVPAARAAFGACTQIDSYGGYVTVVAGAPGVAAAYAFERDPITGDWPLAQAFAPPNDGGSHVGLRPDLRYGDAGTCALSGDLAVVGAPGAEAVHLYYRLWSNSTNGFRWGGALPQETFVSPDRDLDHILQKTFLHRQDYGAAVALEAAGRTLAIGSPLADYDKLGGDEVESYDTYPAGGQERARGRVYVYHSTAPSQTILLSAGFGLTIGSFSLLLAHHGVTSTTTSTIPYNGNADAMVTALETLTNIGRVEASVSAWDDVAGDATYREWSVTFLGEWFASPPLLQSQWQGNGCATCAVFDTHPLAANGDYVAVSAGSSNGAWAQQSELQANDRRAGDRFGLTLALDGETLLVGAQRSAAIGITTWDFETGNLSGWTASGTAFANQPTYGDNAYRRSSYGAAPEHCGLEGRYYIGTFEDRPGLGADDYLTPDPLKPPGGAQGDAPTGTLTSEAFAIEGDSMSLLVGGGCDDARTYVELSVDGVGVARATGRCDERMRRVTWDVSAYRGRMGRITIVDASAQRWGHISVDAIRFAWSNRGGAAAFSHADDGRVDGTASRDHYCLQEETPQSGAAYVFVRLLPDGRTFCPAGTDRWQCAWSQQTKLVPSDKRAGDAFGAAVAVNHAAGIAAVGASLAALTGFWHDTPAVYTTQSPYGTPLAPDTAPIPLPASAARGAAELRVVGAYGSLLQAGSGAPLVWQEAAAADPFDNSRARGNAHAGAVYVYLRTPEVLDPSGTVLVGARWPQGERLKLQPHDATKGDRFGSAVALIPSLRQLLVGAPGSDAFGGDAGALYQFDVGAVHASFSQTEYAVTEGQWLGLYAEDEPLQLYKVEVKVARDAAYARDWLTLEYATSDLTARGVDSEAYLACLALASDIRAPPRECGDYEQTAGRVTFAPGDAEVFFYVRIMDDHCAEPFPEYVQLTLSIPGTAAVQGAAYAAKIRIDDNDRTRRHLPRSDDDDGFADVALLLFMAPKNDPKAYHLEGVLALASCKQKQGAGPSWTVKFTNSRGWDVHGVAAVGLVRLGTLVQARRMFVAASDPLPCATRVPFLASLATGTAHTLGTIAHHTKSLIQHHLASLNKLQAKAVCGVVAAAESIKASHTGRGSASAAAAAAVTAPVLIQGPPGTGKTTAVVQALLALKTLGHRTLVTAPSNKAVQEIAVRLITKLQLQAAPALSAALVGVQGKLLPELRCIHANSLEVDVGKYYKTAEAELRNARHVATSKGLADSTRVAHCRQRLSAVAAALNQAADRVAHLLPSCAGQYRAAARAFDTAAARPETSAKRLLNGVPKLPRVGVSMEKALQSADIVFATLSVCGRYSLAEALTDHPFDVMVVDEAGQALEAEFAIPLAPMRPRLCVMVGDTKQLPATVISQGAVNFNLNRSPMWRLQQEARCPVLMLEEQYRMHPEIQAWPARQFCQDALVPAQCISARSPLPHLPPLLAPYVLFDVDHGVESSKGVSKRNTAEADTVAKVVHQLVQGGIGAESIGVITFYRAQLELITTNLAGHTPGVLVHTVDGFQGGERDIIIMSFVRASEQRGVGFVADARRLNVAVTRAPHSVIMLGHCATLLGGDDTAA
ncbi:hypothetical protein JKP88DRAFT_279922 [Tribonema minus]|uniref:Uncharacterized protein n=1 Tax=Tribonema minus TaxID=303371 RepID=A0A836CDI4_9STRA|nr:hypothetical protein JKP88DRAFT_279922 [Tribonema minus]